MPTQSAPPAAEGPHPTPVRAVPDHIAIIMDGNGRWARRRGRPRLYGHRAGTNNLRRVLEACVQAGIRVVTIYAFSTENWARSREEVSGLFRILAEAIAREAPKLHQNGVQIRHLGTFDGVPPRLAERIRAALDLTRHNTRLVLNVAFNYGGRAEILDAVRQIIRQGIAAEAIDEALFSRFLCTAGWSRVLLRRVAASLVIAPPVLLGVYAGGIWFLLGSTLVTYLALREFYAL